MTCLEEDGMKRVLFKILLPSLFIWMWMSVCRYIMTVDGSGLNIVWYCIAVGFPFGLRKMCVLLLPPCGGSIQSISILAVDFIAGGIIGFFVLAFKILGIGVEIIRFLACDVFGRRAVETE